MSFFMHDSVETMIQGAHIQDGSVYVPFTRKENYYIYFLPDLLSDQIIDRQFRLFQYSGAQADKPPYHGGHHDPNAESLAKAFIIWRRKRLLRVALQDIAREEVIAREVRKEEPNHLQEVHPAPTKLRTAMIPQTDEEGLIINPGSLQSESTTSTQFDDSRGFWSALVQASGTWNLRWRPKPRLYYPAGKAYKKTQQPFVAVDGLGMTFNLSQPFECIMNPSTGTLEKLCVQAPDSVCELKNSTWDRTVIRNVAPKSLFVALLPFSRIPSERRPYPALYTTNDWASLLALWIPAVAGLLGAVFIPKPSPPDGKHPSFYANCSYKGFRYPRLARNFLENKPSTARERQYDPSWAPFYHEREYQNPLRSRSHAVYRSFRPRMLAYLTEESKGYETRFVKHDENCPPYVFIAYTAEHFDSEDKKAKNLLTALAREATVQYRDTIMEPSRKPKAFWLAQMCMPINCYVDHNGQDQILNNQSDPDNVLRGYLADHDTYSISDIIRGAEHIIVIAGNPRHLTANPLREWGKRVWTLPEIILSKGDFVSVTRYDLGAKTLSDMVLLERIQKSQFPYHAWSDALCSRQLLEHYSSLHLSRLELVKIIFECLMDRNFGECYPGDRSYAMMGLLRIRPPINREDTSFQAFARLSLPQDNDRFMERLICLLPNKLDEPWEMMTDQYKSTLWDIHPETQICGVGENDTVIVDNCKGATIQWSGFTPVQIYHRLRLRRLFFKFLALIGPIFFLVALILAGIPTIGPVLIPLSLFLFQLPSPYYIWKAYGDKVWNVEPCLFGIEGYVPLDVIEKKLFGGRPTRLSWSVIGSPLSRHQEGQECFERRSHAPHGSRERQFANDTINTIVRICKSLTEFVVTTKLQGLQRIIAKIFTLVDTLSMTVTLFKAVHPPTVLLIGGSEGGMKRAIACSYDVTTGTFYRETVLRMQSQCTSRMHFLPRIRLGLKRPFKKGDIVAA
ncbi:hypothetical protein MGYG_08230 [Nannizzia gypsea CBS 118893]|uniref:Uncharacterized protein n=1 Tax=Arthroderma gypseum (strain ATCC MYA-4604 / CBS 118893) TaxID=535722 RepID=E4V5E2_ARTGP|nr:hypothetical protein MGYG_08230 [Nannizzia gypsea CBS 118893]EFR05216.1 hypothetical protein MGYG_08230 [Nannizzia gypsea CBS 118893]